MLIVLDKSFVAEHLRYLKSGKSVKVQAHYTKRVKKHTEHAPPHNYNLDHLSEKDRDLFNRMHAEQHVAHFYDGHALRKRVAHHEAEAKKHNDHADELDKQGKHKEAAAARRKADKHIVEMHRHKTELRKVDNAVHGLAAMKERLVAGSGTLDGDAEAIHQHYVSKVGERLKPANKPAAPLVVVAKPEAPKPNAAALAAAKAAFEKSKGQTRVTVSRSSGGVLLASFEDWVSDMYDLQVGLMSPEDKAEKFKEYQAAKKAANKEKGTKSEKAVLSEAAAAAKLNAVSKGGVALKGTPKQREWAEKIRQQRLSAMTPEQVAIAVNPNGLFVNAKWWIETRDMDARQLGAFFEAQKKMLALARKQQAANAASDYAETVKIYNGLTGQFGFGRAERGKDYLQMARQHLAKFPA